MKPIAVSRRAPRVAGIVLAATARGLWRLLRVALTLGAVAAAVVLLIALWDVYEVSPWTRDGRVQADVVDVAPRSRRHHRLPCRWSTTSSSTRATCSSSSIPAASASPSRRAQAAVDGAELQMQLRQADARRRAGLTGVVSAEEQEQFRSNAQVASTSLESAHAALDLAKLNLERATIYAPANGYVTRLRLRIGDYTTAGQVRIAVIDADSFWLEGYFEETKFSRIHVGDPARIQLMGYRPQLTGHVESFIRGHQQLERQHQRAGPSGGEPGLHLGAAGAADSGPRAYRPGSPGRRAGRRHDLLDRHRRPGERRPRGAGRPVDCLAAGTPVKVPLAGALAGLLAAAAAGCTVGPDYVPPKPMVPAQFTEQPATPAQVADATARLKGWWAEFHDALLNRLVDRAIAQNYDLRIARQQLIAARESSLITRSGDYPTVNFGGSFSEANSSTTLQYPPGIGGYRTYELGFDASYEIDVFGGRRRAEESADAQVTASIEDRRTILVSLLAELAADYTRLRGAQLRLTIAQRNVAAERQGLQLTQTSFDRGLGTDLEVAQARAQLETVQADLPSLRATIARNAHAIGVLLGGAPGAVEAELDRPAPLMPAPPVLPASVPSAVVANRPDIRRAERRYAAANAEIGVAVAAEFPQFSIPLTLEPTSSYISQLFRQASLAWTAAAVGTQRVYDGGRTTAQIDRARAAAEQARLGYESTVLGGLRGGGGRTRQLPDGDATIFHLAGRRGRCSAGAAACDAALRGGG